MPKKNVYQPKIIDNQVLTPRVVDEIKPQKIQHRSVNSRGVDITFVFDTTVSMRSKIDALLSACSQLAKDLASRNLDYHASIVAFGNLEVGDSIKATGFTNDLKVFGKMLENIPKYTGGGTLPRYGGESSLE